MNSHIHAFHHFHHLRVEWWGLCQANAWSQGMAWHLPTSQVGYEFMADLFTHASLTSQPAETRLAAHTVGFL